MIVIRFKFDNFPEIKAKHEVFAKLEKDAYETEIKYDDTFDRKYLELTKKLTNELDEFCDTDYSQVVFDEFYSKEPKLVRMNGVYHNWNEVFGNNYKALSDQQRSDLVSLIEGGGAYRLTKEYYEEVEIDNVTLKERKTKRRLKDEDLCG